MEMSACQLKQNKAENADRIQLQGHLQFVV